MKESKRLPCDDIDDFIDGKKNYYGVAIEDKFKKEEEGILYNHEKGHMFIIKVIFCIGGIKKLGLVKSNWDREGSPIFWKIHLKNIDCYF